MRILTVLLSTLWLISCSSKPTPWETERVVVAGRVVNMNQQADQQAIQFKFNSLLKQSGQSTTIAPIDEQGNFRIEMQLAYPQEVLMNYGMGHHLCLSPGDSLYIELNGTGSDSLSHTTDTPLITFSGDESIAALNQSMSVLQQRYLPLTTQYQENERLEQAISNRNPEDFEQYIVKRDQDYRRVWDTFRKENPAYIPALKPWVEDIFTYDALLGRLMYVNLYKTMQVEQQETPIPNLPHGYTNFLKAYDPNDNRIISMAHALFLDQYDQYILQNIYEAMDQDTTITSDDEAFAFLLKRLDEKTSGFTNELIRSKFYIEMLQSSAPQQMLDQHVQPEKLKNTYLRDKAQNALRQLEAFRTAAPPEGIELIQPDSTIQEGLFESIIAPYAGKVIYIDFWAPWCGPCMGEMPYAMELQKYYQGRDVVFLFLCGSCSDDSWRTTVMSQSLKGIHYKPTTDQMNPLYERFGIDSIPRYILVDQQGKVVSDNAPAPSAAKAVIAAIDALL